MQHLLQYLYRIASDANKKLTKAYQGNPLLTPLPYRLRILLEEFMSHTAELMNKNNDSNKLKEQLSILFRCGEMIQEMYTMLERTDHKLSLKSEMGGLEEALSQLVPHTLQTFGYAEALFIVTPHYQQLAGIWK